MSANSSFVVTDTAVGILCGGKRRVGFPPFAVQVPAVATKPEENIPTLHSWPNCPYREPWLRADQSERWATFSHSLTIGSGRNPPHHGGSGRSLKQPFDHSRMVTRSYSRPIIGHIQDLSLRAAVVPCVLRPGAANLIPPTARFLFAGVKDKCPESSPPGPGDDRRRSRGRDGGSCRQG